MLLDWFTVAAQIVNFLILVALLRYFLYGRIIQAMDAREQHIAARLEAAEHLQQAAAHEAAAYRQQQHALEAQRAALLAQAEADVDVQRQALLAAARQEIESVQANWQKAVRDEKEAFLQALRQQAQQQLHVMAHRALQDLAHTDLEQQMLTVFLDKLQTLDADTWATLATAQQDARQPVVIRSAFALPQPARQQLRHILHAYLGETVVCRFETVPEVICGIEVQAAGHKLAWSLEDYLETLTESLEAAFPAETGEAPADNASGGTMVGALQTKDKDDHDSGT